MRRSTAVRRGYALMLVLVFVVLFSMLLGVAYRELAALLRAESVAAQQSQRSAGSTVALARALTLLETRRPPESPYVCGVTIDTPEGPKAYTVTFTATDATHWRVNVSPTSPGTTPPPMPSVLGTAP